jgi:hypothetical protein
MTERQMIYWGQIVLTIVAVVCAVVLAILYLTGCTPDRTVEQDLAVCKGMCEPRPVDEFGAGSEFKTLTCRCGSLPSPPSPCPDAGPRVYVSPW